MKSTQEYDWIIVGGGIAGISIAEILSREGHAILMLEKNNQIASETSKVFHEWLHSGSLYSLVPDNNRTLRYLLGAMDDLFDYYENYNGMNIRKSQSGIKFDQDNGWFNDDFIEYRYRIRKFNPIWAALVSKSIYMINIISNHDWLRRHAGGSEIARKKIGIYKTLEYISSQYVSSKQFYSIKSPDFTMNSRVLINDLLSSALEGGLSVITNKNVETIESRGKTNVVRTQDEVFTSRNVVICSPDAISTLYDLSITRGYAPMAIVDNVPENEKSFVELDYNTRKCINLLKKADGIGQIGGTTVKKMSDVKPYLNYLVNEHKKRNPSLNVIDDYVGIKKELNDNNQNRNYLYHINQHGSNIWSVVLGKFTLAFSMAPEFYRRVYSKNPYNLIPNISSNLTGSELVSKTSWKEIAENKRI